MLNFLDISKGDHFTQLSKTLEGKDFRVWVSDFNDLSVWILGFNDLSVQID